MCTQSDSVNASLKQDLEKAIAERDRLAVLVKNYENIIAMFDNALEFSRTELLGADKMIHAHEVVEGLAREEQMYKDKLIHAHETLGTLTRKELITQDRIEKAYERNSDVARSEQIEKDRIIHAHETVEDMSREEMLDKEKFIEAQDSVQSLSRQELMSAKETIQDMENRFSKLRDDIVNMFKEGPFKDEFTKIREENSRHFKELVSSYEKKKRPPEDDIKEMLTAIHELIVVGGKNAKPVRVVKKSVPAKKKKK
ncbi:MAG: hypothetical protein HZC28_18830 [Spirochaetes bacterium]|nr:hypothetical protein [Spirochaetota bacterium]